jgi:ribose 5-phosphate isomerase B
MIVWSFRLCRVAAIAARQFDRTMFAATAVNIAASRSLHRSLRSMRPSSATPSAIDATMHFAVASDHAAVSLRREVVQHLRAAGHAVDEHGPEADDQRVDYPTEAAWVAKRVQSATVDRGILLCGTGIGVSIAANKFNGIRAALVHDVTSASLAAEHNNANVLCLGARLLGSVVALDCVDAWIAGVFAPRHQFRLDLISALEVAAPTTTERE